MRLIILIGMMGLAGCGSPHGNYVAVDDSLGQSDRPAARAPKADETRLQQILAAQNPRVTLPAPSVGDLDTSAYYSGGYTAGDLESDEEYRPRREFDEYSARRDAEREVYRRGYRGWCSDDCGGHNAGFEWAYDNHLKRSQPTFDSPSFDEGQEAFIDGVRRRVDEKRQEFEDDPDSSDYAL